MGLIPYAGYEPPKKSKRRNRKRIPGQCHRGHKYEPGSFTLKTLSNGYVVRQCNMCRRLQERLKYREKVLARAN